MTSCWLLWPISPSQNEVSLFGKEFFHTGAKGENLGHNDVLITVNFSIKRK